MKLEIKQPNIETSERLDEKFFSIGDHGIVFDILRSKMYSNPILAICREITCNARDAHREIGTPEVPINIYLPNSLENYFKVKDFGPGISPDRIENIFIKYGSSTKREDNIQTGSYGMGAKTPFSYTDSFSVLTNYNGIQYNYSCFIDETKVGKLALFSQSPTKEPNGTEIIVPVQPKDFTAFATWTEQATRHWTIKPIIKGNVVNFSPLKYILEGNRWAITESRDYNHLCKIIIDEIEYPLDLDALKKYADPKLINSAKGNFVMYFDTGDLSLSASREQIYLDQPTQKKIGSRLEEISKEIKQRAQDKIESFDNLWDAKKYYKKDLRLGFNYINFLGVLKWRNIVIDEFNVDTICPTLYFVKGRYHYRHGNDPNKITKSNTTYISPDNNNELYINDTGIKDPTPKHVKKAFENDLSLKGIQIVCPTDKITEASLNKSIYLDKYAPKLLSTIVKTSGRKYTPASSRLMIFKFEGSNFIRTSYSVIDEDASTTKVLCYLEKQSFDTHRYARVNGSIIQSHQITKLLNTFPNTSFYGVDHDTSPIRIEEDLSDLISLDLFLKEKVLDNKSTDFLKIKLASIMDDIVSSSQLEIFRKSKKLITNKNSLYSKCMELQLQIQKINKNDDFLLSLYEIIDGAITQSNMDLFLKNNPDMDLKKINEACKEKYSLLYYLNPYEYNIDISAHVANYVNLIDNS